MGGDRPLSKAPWKGNLKSLCAPPTHHHAAAEWSDPGFPLDRQEHLPLVQADKSLTFIVLIRESSPRVTELKMVSMDCHQ